MSDALKYQVDIGETAFQKIRPQVVDSQSLNFPDNNFDVSITNISVATFKDPVAGLREVHRTLKPGGVAVISHWKRFAVADIIHQIQKNIRPDAKLMFLPGPQYREDGYLRDRMTEVGLAGEQSIEQTIVKGEALQGLREFMMGPFTNSARDGWTDEENGKWEGELDKAIEAEVKE
jgi:ubiquinone/menaquinone biosynthesis C-methylase UbiE